MDDAEALRLTRSGDPRGPEALVAKYGKEVFNLSLRMLGERTAAEDAAQDVFLRAFSRLEQYRQAEPFGAWLAGITRHRCVDLIRSRPRPVVLDPVPATDVEGEALGRIESERIRAALGRLPARDRGLLVLRYWEDRPVGEVAAAFGMTDGAARVALLRARRALGELLS